MNWIPMLAALGVALIVVLLQRSIVRDVGMANLPDHIRDVLKYAPTMKVDRVLAQGNRFRFSGQSDGRPIQIRVKTRGWGNSSSIVRVQILWETRSLYGSLSNKRSIETSEVPQTVTDAARQVVEACVGSLFAVTRVCKAEVQGLCAYDIRGRSEAHAVEIEVLDNGDPLELILSPA